VVKFFSKIDWRRTGNTDARGRERRHSDRAEQDELTCKSESRPIVPIRKQSKGERDRRHREQTWKFRDRTRKKEREMSLRLKARQGARESLPDIKEASGQDITVTRTNSQVDLKDPARELT